MGAPELGIWTVACTALALFLTQPKPTLPGYGLVTCAGQEPARFVCGAVLAGSAIRGGRLCCALSLCRAAARTEPTDVAASPPDLAVPQENTAEAHSICLDMVIRR